jgi:tRNA modification GTPase
MVESIGIKRLWKIEQAQLVIYLMDSLKFQVSGSDL